VENKKTLQAKNNDGFAKYVMHDFLFGLIANGKPPDILC
jgi:hypothetical protein